MNRQEEENEGSTILFTVEGMRCGGCSAAVQKVLVATPGVSRAAVNLVTETAAVELAAGASESTIAEFTKAVGDKGFTMSPRPVGRAAEEAAIKAEARRAEEMERTKWDLYKAWGLTGLCLVTHTTHHLHHFGLHEYAHGELLTALGQPWVGGAIAVLALAGPGAGIMREGFKALANGAPNMNSLVGVGASAAFALSIAGALAPPSSVTTACRSTTTFSKSPCCSSHSSFSGERLNRAPGPGPPLTFDHCPPCSRWTRDSWWRTSSQRSATTPTR